jgi:hypothetical protein
MAVAQLMLLTTTGLMLRSVSMGLLVFDLAVDDAKRRQKGYSYA